MHKPLDLTNRKFGRLTARWPVGHNMSHSVCWLFSCKCGTLKVLPAQRVTSENTRSCGCLRTQRAIRQATRANRAAARANTTHGYSRTREYGIWKTMLARCRNPNVKSFKDYGGRGIRVCVRWIKFENFFADMGHRPSPKHSIDRFPDPNGNYEPGNCRWATALEQAHNKR
jgi:hypothetical protein